MGDWETQKKALLPYLQRAAEIEAVDPKVAYYCRLYAVEQGIKLEHRDTKADDLLELVLNQLEKDKPHLVLDTATDLGHCERFALNVYIKAKRRDEQGISDRDTAKAYYAAFNFIEILKQFGALSVEVEKERRFAVFRAAEIKRCLDEGRDPPTLIPPADGNQIPGEDETMPTQSAPGGPPLIDYDPGYVVGSKVLFMDADSNKFRKGFIRARSVEVGGFFNIEAEGGSQRQLGALFLAPDLSEGGEVTYYLSDGRQLTGTATAMHANEWPPFYTLQLEDGATKEVNHSQFTLISCPVVDIKPNPGSNEIPALPSGSGSVTGSETVERPRPAIPKQSSWLKHKTHGPAINGQSSLPTEETIHDDSVREEEEMSRQKSLPGDPTAFPLMPLLHQRRSSINSTSQPMPHVPETSTYDGDGAVYNHTAIASKPPEIHETLAEFQPGAEAVQLAVKSTNKATIALNFSDVDRAIKCLEDALQWLTKPSNLHRSIAQQSDQ